MPGGDDDIDPEAVLERRERRVSRQGHAAVAGALTVAASAATVLAFLTATGRIAVTGALPVFSVAGVGALGGVLLNGSLIKRVDDPARWFRRVVGTILVAAAVLFAAAYALGGRFSGATLVLAAVFAVAWFGGVAVTWRFR
ncbi:hypothetical protein [Halobaculum limi]|uniref:hypothetical protein n=1 Tax=Halobaculum limi TaxID=3031916 RepID=UPI0024061582|nr:hypothetical protein [Halobaculum sp. YSMS11]